MSRMDLYKTLIGKTMNDVATTMAPYDVPYRFAAAHGVLTRDYVHGRVTFKLDTDNIVIGVTVE